MPTFVPSGILIHPAVWQQETWAENGELCPFLVELGPHLTHCRLGRCLYLGTKWQFEQSIRLATTDMGQKLGVVPPLSLGGEQVTS